MKNERLIRALLTVGLLITGGVVVSYYWISDSLESIVRVPIYLMVVCLIYVLIQIVKRSLFKKQNWWDWLYYIALIVIMLPTFFGNQDNFKLFSYLTDFGTLFMLVPALIDGQMIVKDSK
jgi:Na+-translocating ferredoxin:NAD+ oxidoreductase RnfE subunit